MKEIIWAFKNLKRKEATEKDGLSAEMINRNILWKLWHGLLNTCWKKGMVPTIWRESILVLVPMKKGKGPCMADDFRGISMLLVVYKAMCLILQERLRLLCEGYNLITEEKKGFRRGRGCWDHIYLLGQLKVAERSRGMFGPFIDYSKAYNRIDQQQLWRVLEM